MAYAAVSLVGRSMHGLDAVICALRDAVGPRGTVLAYIDRDGAYDDLLDAEGRP